jgi:CheY-like chemotaxis protein
MTRAPYIQWIFADIQDFSDFDALAVGGELEWVRAQLINWFEVLDQTEKWRSESSTLLELRDNDAAPIVVVASSMRSSKMIARIERLIEMHPEAFVLTVLGEFWSGHGRTRPLPESIRARYWYQFLDRIAPELEGVVQRSIEPKVESATNGTATRTRQALILSDSADNRRLWLDLLPSYGLAPVAVAGDDRIPSAAFELVLIDDCRPPTPTAIAKVRSTFPESTIVVFLDFPTWEVTKDLLGAGADGIVGKPFQLEGLARSFSSAALARK